MANNNEKETFDAAVKSEAFFEKNKKVISGAIIAIIIVVAGVLCYNQFIGGVPRSRKPARRWHVVKSISTLTSLTRHSTETVQAMQVL